MWNNLVSGVTGALAAFSFFWVYFRLLRGVGLRLGLLTSCLVGFISYLLPSMGNILAFALFSSGILLELFRTRQNKQVAHSRFLYEGGGIRRGLKPVEVGVIFDIDPGQLFILGVIDLLEKNFVTLCVKKNGIYQISTAKGYEISFSLLNPKLRRQKRRDLAFSKLKEISGNEDVLMEIFAQNANLEPGNYSIHLWVEHLVRQINDKLLGFDREETRSYYIEYIQHRVNGVQNNYFDVKEYLSWMVLSRYIGRISLPSASKMIKNSHPEWLPSGESMEDWLDRMESIVW